MILSVRSLRQIVPKNTTTIGGDTYVYYTFTTNGTITFNGLESADSSTLLIAGGGAGTSYSEPGGGGGAGGFIQQSLDISSNSLTINVTIGAAGNGGTTTYFNSTGGDSILSGTGFSTITAIGGGRGGGHNGTSGGNGGSGGGGGSGSNLIGGTGTVGQGYDGGKTVVYSTKGSSGGGGAGGPGGAANQQIAGDGGPGKMPTSIPKGLPASITGTTYCGGGGGGGNSLSGAGWYTGIGGSGGGGNGNAGSGNVGFFCNKLWFWWRRRRSQCPWGTWLSRFVHSCNKIICRSHIQLKNKDS